MRPARRNPGIFRRRMILQLTSLLDLLLIIVFVQYLEMQQVSSRAIARETQRRQAAENERDMLLAGNDHPGYEVWQIHLNDNRSAYPPGSWLIKFDGRTRLLETAHNDSLIALMKSAPRPAGSCILLLTSGNVSEAQLREAQRLLESVASDPRLREAWGVPAAGFSVVTAGYTRETP
jgi:hypothetical protein